LVRRVSEAICNLMVLSGKVRHDRTEEGEEIAWHDHADPRGVIEDLFLYGAVAVILIAVLTWVWMPKREGKEVAVIIGPGVTMTSVAEKESGSGWLWGIGIGAVLGGYFVWKRLRRS
jgi:hypothetical protein